MLTASDYDLERFMKAQSGTYTTAYEEIKQGRKRSHWMWFIFPQIKGLGYSEVSKHYAIADLKEAELYLADKTLGPRLLRISLALLEVEGKSANEIFGSPDDMKLKSSMTLFSALKNTDSVFQNVLEAYFNGCKDDRTLQLIR